MPELPEVETTLRGISPFLEGRRIDCLIIRESRLRWRIPPELPAAVAGKRVRAVRRRAKYLLLDVEGGTVILHLGMSGNLRILPAATPPLPHDHLDIVLDSGNCLRFNDPRRFGSVLWTEADPAKHRLLRDLAPEPLSREFDGAYLVKALAKRKVAIKQLLMNGRVVVGVGNIYASEALFHAGIRPQRAAGRTTRLETARLVRSIKKVLRAAIKVGGTTLRDYVNADGNPGYFRQKLFVYERGGEPCRRCGTPIRALVQGQRATYYCPACQQ
jgi:formamidopyrimidine-DNA glycosylase